MTLAMTNLQNGGRRGRSSKAQRKSQRRGQKKGGMAGIVTTANAVPASLLLLNQYLKARKSRKAGKKSAKKTAKRSRRPSRSSRK